MNNTTAAKRPAGIIIAASTLCALGIAGAVTGIIVAFASPAGATHNPVTPSHHTVAPITPVTPVTPVTPNPPHVTPTTPAVPALPAAQVETIQRELAQLNYYEGPIDGIMGPQTRAAITYLQRDSDLPQTGEFNQITYLALQRMLATGNNQMAG